MNLLPRSGPSRPHHHSYSQPMAGWTVLDVVALIVIVAIALEVLSYV